MEAAWLRNQTTLRNNPENHDVYFTAVKISNYSCGLRVLRRMFGPKWEARETCVMRSFVMDDGIKKVESAGTCSTHGKCEKCLNISAGNVKGRDQPANLRVIWRMILNGC
jgi:hypothetical protein